MKKILLLVFLFVLGKMSYSQGYPLTQNLGSDSTIVVSKGALQSRLIPIVIADTNAANAQRLKTYPGAQLYTTAGDFYIRNSNATKWILVSSGSSGSVNIYTADGTLTGNRTLTGANNNLTFTGLNKFTVSTADTTAFNTDVFNIKGIGGVLNVEGTAAGTTSSLTLKTASDGNWTISTGQVNFNSGDLRFYDNDNGANRMIIKPSGNVGIGTETPDSLLTVNGGVYVGGGIRAPGLPTALGTKALRINAQGQISVADTTLGGGTVISVGTNNGSGITGGPITVSGTLAIDTTNVIATKSSVTGGLAGKLNISDTASMLSPYLRKADTTAMLAPYLRAIDTASLSNRINLKLNISDTASMLGNYLNNVGYGLSKVGQVASADSATLSAYYLRRKDSLTTTNPLGYVTKKILADTAAAIRSSDAGGTVTSVATNNGTGITGGTITTSGTLAIDTLLVSTRAWRQKGVDSVAALANTKISGSLISGYLTKATGTNTLGNSIMQDNGSTINLAGGMIATGSLEGSGIRANDVIQFQNINTSSSLTGYTTLQADSTNKTFRFNFGDGVRIAEFKYAASSYTYNLPSSNGTLALTSDLTGGTVTSVATNNGTGITGGTITTSGTLAIDTTVISTRAWRQKGIDSVASLITGSYVPLSRTLTINGTSFDLSANRTWNVGTVTTAAASGGGQVAFFNGSTVITSVTGLYFDGTNKLAIGSSSPDSMLSVTQGAHIQRGVRLSGLPTAPGTRSLRIDANGTLSVSDTLANGMSGSGTPNYIPKFTGSNSIGNSVIYESSSNIGIGTISPNYPLHINSTSNARIGVQGTTNFSAFQNINSSGSVYWGIDDNAGANFTGTAYGRFIYSSGAYPLIFFTNSTERMRLDASGNLGIGTTSPSGIGIVLNLYGGSSINSNLVLEGNSGNSFLSILSSATNGVPPSFISKDGFRFAYASDKSATGFAEHLRITSGGNVGIGTTSPATTLEVAGSVRAYLNSATSTELFAENNTVKVRLIAGTSSSFLSTTTNHPLIFETNNAERMRITSGGSLLLGTTTDKTTIIGASGTGQTIGGSGTPNLTVWNTGNADWVYSVAVGNDGTVYQYNKGNTPMLFYTNNAERMRITSGGEVYIAGTTDQGAYNLQVNGTGVWGAGAYVDGSDSALKKNVQPLDNSLEIIKQMRPVTFEYQPFYSKDTATQTGFIAQELQQVLADKVYKNGVVKEGGAYLGVAYQSIIPLLVKSIQELEAQVQELKSQLNNR